MGKSNPLTADSPEKTKTSRWVVRLLLVFMVGMFITSATPFGLAVWLGKQDDEKQMSSRIQQAPLHKGVGILSRVFRVPRDAQKVYWREVSMFRPLQPSNREDKALWAVLHYDEADFEALLAQWPTATPADVKVFLPWLLKDIGQNMNLQLSAEVKVLKLPAELFAAENVPPNTLSAYAVPSQQSLLLMRFGAAEFVFPTQPIFD